MELYDCLPLKCYYFTSFQNSHFFEFGPFYSFWTFEESFMLSVFHYLYTDTCILKPYLLVILNFRLFYPFFSKRGQRVLSILYYVICTSFPLHRYITTLLFDNFQFWMFLPFLDPYFPKKGFGNL